MYQPCDHCIRINIACKVNTHRHRKILACKRCRRRGDRCDFQQPCQYCSEADEECVYYDSDESIDRGDSDVGKTSTKRHKAPMSKKSLKETSKRRKLDVGHGTADDGQLDSEDKHRTQPSTKINDDVAWWRFRSYSASAAAGTWPLQSSARANRGSADSPPAPSKPADAAAPSAVSRVPSPPQASSPLSSAPATPTPVRPSSILPHERRRVSADIPRQAATQLIESFTPCQSHPSSWLNPIASGLWNCWATCSMRYMTLGSAAHGRVLSKTRA